MSVKVMGWVWEIQDLSLTEKLVLLAYADHAHHDGSSIFPSRETIARKTCVSGRSVQRVTQSLIAKGLLVKEGQHESGTNLFRIPVPDYEKGDRVSPPLVIEVTESPGGETESRLGGDRESPEPSLTIINPDIKNIRANGGVSKFLADMFEYPDLDPRMKKLVGQMELKFGDERLCNKAYEIKVDSPEILIGALLQRIEEHG